LEGRSPGTAGAPAPPPSPVRRDVRPPPPSALRAEASAPPEPAGNGPAAGVDAWSRLLLSLESEARTLGELLRARARLESLTSARAVLRLAGVRDEERAILTDARNVRVVSAALARVLGRKVEVEIAAASGDPPPKA